MTPSNLFLKTISNLENQLSNDSITNSAQVMSWCPVVVFENSQPIWSIKAISLPQNNCTETLAKSSPQIISTETLAKSSPQITSTETLAKSSPHIISTETIEKSPKTKCTESIVKSSPKTKCTKTTLNAPPKHICPNCNKVLYSSFSRRRHSKTCDLSKKNFRYKCSECTGVYPSSDLYFQHMPVHHRDIALNREKFVFATDEEFYSWKLKMEKETTSCYVRKYSQKRSDGQLVRTESYSCHRSGCFESRGTGKRQLKHEGSNKCGFYCPAFITRYVEATGGSSIIYQSVHMGHSCEVSRLNLSKPEKVLIAEQIFNGVPAQAVLEKVQEKANSTERLASVSLIDLRNIAATYGLSINTSGKTEESFPSLSSDDFVLGIMNDVQEELLRMCGNDIISISTTMGENEHKVQFTSLVVKDNWQSFPVAFLWSNRLSENLLKEFFIAIKKRVPDLNCKTLICDDCIECYDAWCKVFGAVDLHVTRNQHVRRRWTENASAGPNCIQNIAKRNEVLNILYSMSVEMNEHVFQCSLEINTSSWLEDPETVNFAEYFMAEYAKKANIWAACYQDTNDLTLNAKKWHEDLAYDDKFSFSLDQAIYHLMKPLRRKLLDPFMSLSGANLSKILDSIKKCHQLAEDMSEKIRISPHESDENAWLVPSFSQAGVTYTVKKLEISAHKCNLCCSKCTKCLHQYCCDCPDTVIQFNFCKHIHIVCMNTQASLKRVHFFFDACREDEENNAMDNRYEEISARDHISLSNNLSLREKAYDSVNSFLPYLNTLTSNVAFEEVISTMEALKSKLQAIEHKESSLL